MNNIIQNNKSLKKIVLENLFFSEIAGIFSRIGAFIFTLIIIRTFIPEDFGMYSLALAIILGIMVLSDLGFGTTLTRYFSASIGKNKEREARSRFLFLFKWRILSSFLISLLLFLGAGLIASFFKKPELMFPLKIGSMYLFLNSILTILFAISTSLQKVKFITWTEFIFQFSRILLIFFLFYFYKSIAGVFIILVLSLLFATIFLMCALFFKYPFLIKGEKEPVERRRMLKFSSFIALGSFTIFFYENIDKLVLGYFLKAEFVGYYAAIFSVVAGISGLLMSTSVLLPVFTQLSEERLKQAFKKSLGFLSILAFPAAIGMAFIALPLLKILYGLDYVPGQYGFSLLLTSIFLSLILLESSFTSMYKVLFNSQEKPKIPSLINFITAIINVILNIILISYLIKINPSYGLIGASGATFFSRFIGLVFLVIISHKKLKISPDKNTIIKPLIASLVMLLYLFIFKHFITLNIATGIIMILSAAMIYFLTVFLIKGVVINEIREIIKKD